jgi:hypothetical protein
MAGSNVVSPPKGLAFEHPPVRVRKRFALTICYGFVASMQRFTCRRASNLMYHRREQFIASRHDLQ